MKPLPRKAMRQSSLGSPSRTKGNLAPRRGRPVGDREAKSGELLAAARSVIARDGYAEASLRKVAQRAGCTTGAVTYYFASKNAMVAAVVEDLFDEFDGWLEQESPSVDLRAIFDKMIRWTTSDRGDPWQVSLQLLVRASADPSLAAIFQKRYAKVRRKLASMLEKAQAQGRVRKDFSADLLADQISAMGDGWGLMIPVEPGRFSRGRLNELVDMAIEMLAPQSS